MYQVVLITAGHRVKTTGSSEISIKKKKHQNSQNQHDYKEFQYFNLTTWNYNSIKTYKFVDIFPVTVGDIALSYESGDTIEEFDVEFAVQSIIIKYEAGAITPPRG